MGQFNSTPAGTPEMLAQAVKLYQLAETLDETYLNSRILAETATSATWRT
jgi:hypothetical protein